jgi:hypothetical protein
VDIEKDLRNPPEPKGKILILIKVIANFPTDRSHGWKYLKIHKNKLYVQVGAPCIIIIIYR